MIALRALQRLARPRDAAAGERCEICAAPVGEVHRHVVDLQRGSLGCACAACAILFVDPGAGGGRYRTVPDRVRRGAVPRLTDEAWAAMGAPVRLAFFVRSARACRWVARYPGPAGLVEAELSEERVADLAARAPLFEAAEPDVEAVLVYGPRGAPLRCLLVPITVCYELVARMRRSWKGIDGGDEARREVDRAFDELLGRARPLDGARGGRP